MPDRVLVVGNGESRQGFDLSKFKKDFLVVGCNALYRDFDIEYLVCCDPKMLSEIATNLKNPRTKVYTRDRWISRFQHLNMLPDIPYRGTLRSDKPENWGSGVYALLLACSLTSQEIVILGFDLYGINKKFNNVYKDTTHYKTRDDEEINYNLWIYQISKIFECFPYINFVVVNNKDWKFPIEWKLSNVTFKNIDDFFLDNKYSCSTISL